MEVKKTQSEPRTLELRDLLDQLCRRWYVPAVILAVCLLFTLFYTNVICTPMYDSTAKIYVGKTTNEQVSTGDVSVSTYLAKDYAELIADRTVLNTVIERLDLNYSYGSLRSRISIDNPLNTRIISVTVRTSDPRQSMRIAQSVCEVAQEKIMELFNIDFVSIISEAYMPALPSTPDLGRNLLYALAVGVLISVLVLLILNYADDRINCAEDVERYLGISILATIPYARSRTKTSSRRPVQPEKTNTAVRSKAKNG